MKSDFNEKKELKIDFQSVEYGLIYFTMTLGEKSFETKFSEVFDPLPDLKSWLEAVSLGVMQCSFSFDTEGEDIKFDFERITYNREIFTVTEPYSEPSIFLSDCVDRKQIVKEFYFEFLNFCDSPRFDRYKWEKMLFRNHLTSLLEANYETLLIGLSQLGRKQLNDWLCRAAPRYWQITPSAKEEKKLADDLRLELLESRQTFDSKTDKSEIFWNIPLDYSNWSIDEKRKLVEECLNENCSNYEGMKITDFRSNIIEDFLA